MDNFGEKVTFIWSVADLLRDVSDEREFYRKVLRYIAYGHLQGPEMTAMAMKRMAEESVQMYPWR